MDKCYLCNQQSIKEIYNRKVCDKCFNEICTYTKIIKSILNKVK